MNMKTAKSLYQENYINDMNWEAFDRTLHKGMSILRQNPHLDNDDIRTYSIEDQKAINIAMEYNQELMVMLLRL